MIEDLLYNSIERSLSDASMNKDKNLEKQTRIELENRSRKIKKH